MNSCVRYTKIIVPSKVDNRKWAVIACDQYTSEVEYWKKVEEEVGTSPSALRLIFPEVYLRKGRDAEIISSINQHMHDYLAGGLLCETETDGAMLVRRTLPCGRVRCGMMVAIDLECYEYKPGNTALIRATENTIQSRIPPRLKVRENAPIELPHVLVLIDDPNKTVIEPLLGKGRQVYDFDLMQDSGHLQGHWIDDPPTLEGITNSLAQLISDKMLFAVGDGNHSLAAAKHHWENLKSSGAPLDHPARYSLVEIENIHDTSLLFEPIHRLLTGADPVALISALTAYVDALEGELPPQTIKYMYRGEQGSIHVPRPRKRLVVATLTDFLDGWLSLHKSVEVDYIHGMHAIESHPDSLAFILPAIDKSNFFQSVRNDGILPRKTFSMGHADEKRFYFEAKFIR